MAIEAEGLRKRYGDTEVLKGVNLSVPEGTVLGVLGPNGAGKTTTVRILATLLPPDDGRATVAGHDVVEQPKEVRRRIGLAGQYAAVDERLTGRENLTLIGRLYRLGRAGARKRAGELLERFDLTHAAHRETKTYSGGMRRRLDLAASLLAEPAVLFLDEPTTGLDLTSRMTLWSMVREQVDAGVTVLLTTQYLEEADHLADRIAVIDKGQVIADGTPDELKRKVGGERLEVSLADASDAAEALRILERISVGSAGTSDNGCTLTVPVASGIGAIAEAASALRDRGVEVTDFAMRRPSMDDVFLSLTGQAGSAEAVEEQEVTA
ncbi:daunorubicin resistance protein DrrA family ABC transporter ATP-binding protein [Streptomyces capoamus]|uniref:ABC-type xenobiotic transporter n=1 Tax=Streptomyces capoamus TaxID=68183 RepID=A0A919F476_9ACTN|nr:ATP-binding cassette domain-containing protein [Streptomyces capoamus]GGW13132.1 daunorubicin resistance protein DrrA family ABC transporter ATP-binding protein [Streptomyces libani subsp. rufus]GHG77930.1 daunorubicin resistance protein DrrA family ABC transporter ATP-binding protein [Streptomyces capoamus]